MQLARLIEPRESRTLGAKLKQMVRARCRSSGGSSKREILERYLTCAPYGGNLEGIRAAALAYFGKEPQRLTLAEAALLVALPQLAGAPPARPQCRAAHAARDRVLDRMALAGGRRRGARLRQGDGASRCPPARQRLPLMPPILPGGASAGAPAHRTS